MEERLFPDIIIDIYKRVARIGMSEKQVNQVSRHSVRVSAAQDFLAVNIDLGRSKSTRKPMRYYEGALAPHGGMAYAARKQGRNVAATVQPAGAG